MNIIYEFIFVSIFFLIVYLFKLKKKEGKGKKAKKRAKKIAKKERKKAKKRAKKERKKVKKRARKTEKKKPKKFDFIRDVKKSIYFWKFFFSFKWFRSFTDIITDVFNFILIVIKKLWNILINIKDIDFYKVFKSLFIFLIFIFYWILCLLTGLIIFSIQIFKFVGNFFSGIWNEIKKLF